MLLYFLFSCSPVDPQDERPSWTTLPNRARLSDSPSQAASNARPKTMKTTPEGIHISSPATCWSPSASTCHAAACDAYEGYQSEGATVISAPRMLLWTAVRKT